MDWHYAVNDERLGPVDESAIGTLIGSGVITRTSLVWRPGMADWSAAQDTPLAKYFAKSLRPPTRTRARVGTPSANPYGAPAAPLTTRSPGERLERREVWITIVLSLVTLGLYTLYLQYAWAVDTNRTLGREKYPPLVPPIVTVLTCFLGGILFPCLYAFDLEKAAIDRGLPDRMNNLGGIITGLQVGGLVAGVFSGGVLLIAASLAAIGLLQAELNKFAEAPQTDSGQA